MTPRWRSLPPQRSAASLPAGPPATPQAARDLQPAKLFGVRMSFQHAMKPFSCAKLAMIVLGWAAYPQVALLPYEYRRPRPKLHPHRESAVQKYL